MKDVVLPAKLARDLLNVLTGPSHILRECQVLMQFEDAMPSEPSAHNPLAQFAKLVKEAQKS